jgi:spermidine synthase
MSSFYLLPSPFVTEYGTVMLLEPPDASVGALRAALLDHSYPRPFVIDDGNARYLYFSIVLMQSAMRLARPHELMLRYTQEMMAVLLFVPRPRRIVLLGLGGGSLAKFCHARLPGCDFTAVELNADVIALRDAFLLPPDDDFLHVVQGEGGAYLAAVAQGIDILFVDAFDRTGFAPELASREFFACAWHQLGGQGVLAVNLAGERASYAGLVDAAMLAFDDQVIVVEVPEDGNHILYAFKQRPFEPRWRWLHTFARELRGRFGLDFPAFVSKLERSAKSGIARQVRGQ